MLLFLNENCLVRYLKTKLTYFIELNFLLKLNN